MSKKIKYHCPRSSLREKCSMTTAGALLLIMAGLFAVTVSAIAVTVSAIGAEAWTSRHAAPHAGKVEELRKQREEVKRSRAEAALKVEAAQATADALAEALEAVQLAVNAQQDSLAVAEAAALAAEAMQREAEAAVAEHEKSQQSTESLLREAAVESYIRLQTPVGSVNFLSDDPWRNARHRTLVGFATGSHIDEVDRLRAVGASLEQARNAVVDTTVMAQQRRDEITERLDDLADARDPRIGVHVAGRGKAGGSALRS